MFFKNLLPDEVLIMEEFIKYKVHCIAKILPESENGLIKSTYNIINKI